MSRGVIGSLLRTLLIQASWSYERMTGVGVAFASEPLLRTLPGGPDGDRYREALGRAAAQFNSHPFLVGAAVGALARTEHEGMPPDQMVRLRTALAGPLGSVGDKLVWAGSVPIASAIGLFLAVTVSPLLAVVALLLLHNAVNLCLRIWAFKAGWCSGASVARRLDVPAMQRGLKAAGPATAFMFGAMLPVVTDWLASDLEPTGIAATGLMAGAGLLLARWIWPTLGGLRFGLFSAVIAAAVGWL